MGSESSDKFVDNGWSCCLNFKSFIDGSCKFVITDSQFNFGFLFHGEFFTEEIDENFRGFTSIGAADSIKSDSWWFEGEKFLQMSDFAESLEASNLWLNWVNTGIDLIELFKFEEGITDWAFEENEQDHELFCWMKRLL